MAVYRITHLMSKGALRCRFSGKDMQGAFRKICLVFQENTPQGLLEKISPICKPFLEKPVITACYFMKLSSTITLISASVPALMRNSVSSVLRTASLSNLIRQFEGTVLGLAGFSIKVILNGVPGSPVGLTVILLSVSS